MLAPLLFIWLSDVVSQHLERHYLELVDDSFVIGVARNLSAGNDRLILMENRDNRIADLSLYPVLGKARIIATEGEGPGEIYLPYFMTTSPRGEIIVYDHRGLSFFAPDSRFSHRFRIFTPGLSMAASEDRVFFLTIRDNAPHLIDVYSFDGERLDSFGEKFLEVGSVAGNRLARINNERYIYDGRLLYGGNHLFYLNSRLARFTKHGPDGEIVLMRDAVDDFGALGRFNRDKNQAYLDDPALLEDPEGVISYQFFQDACIAGDKLYLLRVIENHPDWWTETKSIFVFDTEDLELVEVLTFHLAKGERVHSFAVPATETGRRILVNMEANDRLDIQIAELRP